MYRTSRRVLFEGAVEAGREAWQGEYLAKIPRTIEIARVLQPRCIRLLACRTERRARSRMRRRTWRRTHPWAIAMYREAVEQVRAAGFDVLIENEAHKCIWSRPAEVLSFFERLGTRGGLHVGHPEHVADGDVPVDRGVPAVAADHPPGAPQGRDERDAGRASGVAQCAGGCVVAGAGDRGGGAGGRGLADHLPEPVARASRRTGTTTAT